MKKLLTILALAGIFLLVTGASARTSNDATGLLTDTLRVQRTVADGPHPSVFIYGNDVVYGTSGNLNSQIGLRTSINPNGNSAARRWFLSLRNNATGVVRYIDNSGLLDPGVIRDIDGFAPDQANPIAVTAVEDLVLLGDGGRVSGAIAAGDIGTGNYTFVLDLRELSGQRSVVWADFGFCVVDGVVEVTANITQDTTWVSSNAYFINNRLIQVEEGATLTIERGTWVLGTGQLSALEIQRGARIEAVGTKAQPIVMTSATEVGQRARSQWGGLVINGRAPINTVEQASEGTDSLFGGDDPADSSGTLCYVRVEFAGIEFSPDNELNGIAFQGVGNGTLVHHIQVHFNKDDGVEFFGGTVNAKNILLTGDADDSLDWVLGWVGKLQFVIAQQSGDDADQGIEADNLSDNNDQTPISSPMIYNCTFIGDPDPSLGESDTGVLLREGTGGILRNFIVAYFKEAAVDIDNQATLDRINGTNGPALEFTNSIFWQNCNGGAGNCSGPDGADQFSDESDDEGELLPFTTADWITGNATNRVINPSLRNALSKLQPDFRPNLNSPALNLNFVATPPDDGFFDSSVTYIGGMGPLDDWTKGWTYFGPF